MSRVRRQTIGVALFPFLAVLICTMGALIVLLVMMVANAGVEAKQVLAAHSESTAEAAAEEQALRERHEDAVWRREILEAQRHEKTQQLADRRQALAHLEDHIRRLEEQARQLLARAKEIDKGDQLRDQDLAAARAELTRLHDEIAKKSAELAKIQEQQKKADGWYALIPYDGPNGTRRRPVYIECTREGVILQPEGVVLTPQDFNGSLGPGNPLDAALRATREHLAKASGGKIGEAYPLLVVRPDGIIAYNVARAAMRSWEDEFGYELVSDDKKLVFGPADPALSDLLLETIAVARQRQEAFVAAMPRRYNDSEPLTSFAPEAMPEYESQIEAGAAGGSGLGSGSGAGRQTLGGGSSGAIAGGFGSSTNGTGPSDPFAVRPGSPGGVSTEGGSSAQDNRQPGQAGGIAHSPGSAEPANRYAGQSPGQARSSASGQSTGQAAGPAATQPGGQSGGTSSFAAGSQRGSTHGPSKKRGANWGIPGAQAHQTGITRPIRVTCLSDRIVVLPERGEDRAPQVIPVSPAMTPQEADAVVAAVQKQMRDWGLAVAGGYWKPQLNVEVGNNAEPRFAELQTALQGSGYDLQRKTR